MDNYRSVISYYPNERIDSRFLYLEAEFFELTKVQVNSLIQAFIQWTGMLFSEQFITNWFWNSRNVNPEKLITLIVQENAGIISLEGAVICDQIYNRKTLNKYNRELMYPPLGDGLSATASEDYFAFYCKCVSRLMAGEIGWKDAVMSFFYEPNRIGYTTLNRLELQGIATMIPYHANNNLFFGTISLSLPVECMGQMLPRTAKKFADFLSELADSYTNINGRVAVTPMNYPSKCSGHMHYFGNGVQTQDGSLPCGYLPSEWYPHYYICGVEWFNIISPLAQVNLPALQTEAKNADILFRRNSNGSIIISSKKEVNHIDVADLKQARDLLYNGLYPGRGQMSKKAFLNPNDTGYLSKPRMYWEYLPIREDEIVETEDTIIFRHLSNNPKE